ncbi:hypothetical protein RsTz2092_10230 [Deferribacterales bacterium RsTz2092]
MTGHMLGATGAAEVIYSALALRDKLVPPTINYETKDPKCDLNYTPNKSAKLDTARYALSNSFGFGGTNSTIIVKRYE